MEISIAEMASLDKGICQQDEGIAKVYKAVYYTA
jgi:hypothetical protein